MNPLIRKEIRLVLPAWLAVLFLEMALPWIVGDQDAAITYAPCYFFFGMVLLAVDSFGREFSLGTFSSLMAQPMERRQVWRTKLAVLLAAAALIFAAYFISCELRLLRPVGENEMPFDPKGFAEVMAISGMVLLVALTGGLWTALLLRQISAALWIAWLAPVGLLLSVIFVASLIIKAPSNLADDLMLYGAAGVYVVFAFWLAHRLFFRAEDAGWTGGVISFSKWRYFERAGQATVSQRTPRSLAALVKKEFQLQSVSLLFAAALLGLHVVVFLLRVFYSQAHPNSLAAVATDCFWLLWLLLPLVIGCMAVAEERKLGVMEEQFCLPMTRRRQFSVKLGFALVWGVLLGGVMPVLLETAARRLGAPGEFFKHPDPHEPFFILALAAGLAWAGFFASTLARSFLQALSIAIVGVVGGSLFFSFLTYLGGHDATFFGLMPIPWIWWFLLGTPTFIGVFLWLSYRTFTSYQEGRRLWRRNMAGLLGAGLFVLAGSALIYERCWEVFIPAEPGHGPAVLSLAHPPVLHKTAIYPGQRLRIQLPDGRVVSDSLQNNVLNFDDPSETQHLLWRLWAPLPRSGGPRALIPGSNWVSIATWDNHITGAIRSDGTLWLSSGTQPADPAGLSMKQYGTETNWREISTWPRGLMLLKTDGTLWVSGGTNNFAISRSTLPGTNRPDERPFYLQQLGANSDWQEIYSTDYASFAQKKDGAVWTVRLQESKGVEWSYEVERAADMDSVVPKTFTGISYVGRDGTLWIDRGLVHASRRAGNPEARFRQIGRDTNWVAVADDQLWVVALKSDGSLWGWNFTVGGFIDWRATMGDLTALGKILDQPPVRLGIHQDWVGLTGTEGGVVTLAADGSLWFWPGLDYEMGYEETQPHLLKLPKQPEWLGNVLARLSTSIILHPQRQLKITSGAG